MLKRKILNSIKTSQTGEAKGLPERIAAFLLLNKPRFALTVAAVLAIISAFLIVYVFNLNKTISTQESRITLLENEVEKNKELLSVLTSQEIEIVIMNGLEVNPSGYGKIIWDPKRKNAILQISNLPQESNDKDYQLWVIKDNIPISAGVFSTEEKTENFYKIENLAEVNKNLINAFAVTLEPKGGVPQPTGEMYLLGKPSF